MFAMLVASTMKMSQKHLCGDWLFAMSMKNAGNEISDTSW